MSADSPRAEETREWLERAQEDLDVARWCAATKPLRSLTGFVLLQQAVEKLLKGFLTWHSTVFSKTHSLEELAKECCRLDASLKPALHELSELSMQAIRSRYPDAGEPPEPAQLPIVLAIAEDAFRAVYSRLPDGLQTPTNEHD